jgi:hypothetical protein
MKVLNVDLVGCSSATALDEVAPWAVREAWKHGYGGVRFFHGARGIETRSQSDDLNEAIKLGLRSALRRGEFFPYALGPRSTKHKQGAFALFVALRQNLNAEPEAPWMPPHPEFDPGPS